MAGESLVPKDRENNRRMGNLPDRGGKGVLNEDEGNVEKKSLRGMQLQNKLPSVKRNSAAIQSRLVQPATRSQGEHKLAVIGGDQR